jgi:hypothetical protein
MCESCDYRRMVRLMSRLRDRENSRDATRVTRDFVKEFVARSVSETRAYCLALEKLENYYEYLSDKYNCFVTRHYKFELSLVVYNIPSLEEKDYLDYVRWFELCYCPVEQRFMKNVVSDLFRRVSYPSRGPVIFTNWDIFDSGIKDDQMIVDKDVESFSNEKKPKIL